MTLADHPLPGGSFTIDPAENAAVCRAIGWPVGPEARAHPIHYYIASQAAMGLSVAELLALCAFDVKDGPMMLESEVEFDAEFELGRRYGVTGRILSLERRPSRTFGAVDVLRFELSLSDERGGRVARCVNSWILPRREEAQ